MEPPVHSIFNKQKDLQKQNSNVQETEKRLLPIIEVIFDIEMPHRNKYSVLKWIFIKGLWALVLTICSILTINMGSTLISSYAQHPTTTNLTVIYGDTFQLPKSSFCLPLFAFELDDMGGNITLDDTTTYYRDQIKIYFEQQEITKAQFLSSFGEWPNAVQSVTVTYLTLLNYAESFELVDADYFSNKTFWFSSALAELTYINERYGDSWEAALKLELYLSALNVSFNELQQAVGKAVGIALNLEVTYFAEKFAKNIANSTTASYIGYNWICYVIDFVSLNISLKSDEYVEIAMHGTTFPWKYGVYPQMPMIPVDLKNRHKMPPLHNTTDNTDNIMQGIFGTTRKYSASATAVYRAMSIKNNAIQCYENKTYEICRWECRRKLIRELCGCNALSLPGDTVLNGINCSMAIYTSCQLAYSQTDDQPCIQTCLQPCERWKFTSQMIEETETVIPIYCEIDRRSGRIDHCFKSATIRLAVTDFDYPLFEEQYYWTLEVFVGAFGGVLGLFLGIDATILLQLILYIGTIFYGVWVALSGVKKKKTTTTEPIVLKQVIVVPK